MKKTNLHPNNEIIIVGFAKKVYEGLKPFPNERIIKAMEEDFHIAENLIDEALEMMVIADNNDDEERVKYLDTVISLLEKYFL